MHRAIAARRRLCQAVLLAALLGPRPAWTQATPHGFQRSPYEQESTASGIVVREACVPSAFFASGSYKCGRLASRTVDVITRLSKLLGPFPHKMLNFDLAQFLDVGPTGYVNSAAGEIHASIDVFEPSASALRLPDLLPREVARQWVLHGETGSRVKNRVLAEGLPEYLAWRYLRETSPETARALVAEAMRNSPAGNPGDAPKDGPKRHALPGLLPEFLAERQRGLLILRTLETVIDRERVDRVLPEFVRRYGRRSFSLADFEKVCEEVAGRNLGWFFRYFFDEGGIPEIELRRVPSESPGVVAGEIVVHGLPPEGSVRVEMAVRTALPDRKSVV